MLSVRNASTLAGVVRLLMDAALPTFKSLQDLSWAQPAVKWEAVLEELVSGMRWRHAQH